MKIKTDLFFLICFFTILIQNATSYPSLQSIAKNEDEKCVHCPQYVNATAETKEEIIFDKIQSTEYEKGSYPKFFSICESNERAKGAKFNNIFDRFSDERPSNFRRFFHENSIIAKVKYVASENNPGFTGLFKGAEHGVLRFSPLAPLMRESYLVNYFLGTYLFSFALKMFRNGMHSGNFIVGESRKTLSQYSDSRQFYDKPNFNIFSRALDNMSSISTAQDSLFGEFERITGIIGLSDIASYDVDGIEETSPKSPIYVQFKPNSVLNEKFGLGPAFDFREWTTTEDAIPTGTVLYTAWTTLNKETGESSLCVDKNGNPQADDDVSIDCPEQEVVKIGEVISTSRFYVSKWADEYLFFQHTRACPKDQSKCNAKDIREDEDRSSLFGLPATIYAGEQEDACVSSMDREVDLSGIAPSCPDGTKFIDDNCHPGTLRKVEEIQVSQCPILNKLDEDILFIGDEEATESGSCSFFSSLQTTILDYALFIISSGIRAFLWIIP